LLPSPSTPASLHIRTTNTPGSVPDSTFRSSPGNIIELEGLHLLAVIIARLPLALLCFVAHKSNPALQNIINNIPLQLASGLSTLIIILISTPRDSKYRMTDGQLTGNRVVLVARLAHCTYHHIFVCVSLRSRCNSLLWFLASVGRVAASSPRMSLCLSLCLSLSLSVSLSPVCLMAFLNLHASHLVSCHTMCLYPGLNGRLSHHLISGLFSSKWSSFHLDILRVKPKKIHVSIRFDHKPGTGRAGRKEQHINR
jgi:hypothetical protein